MDMDDDPTSIILNHDLPAAVDPTVISTNTDPTAILTTTRRTQVKLTAERLLSERGLPYIMKNAPKRIRISKRKSGYDNLTNIIQFYQLWAHELYPKAKFNDFLKLCQTLGKTDRELREYRTNLFMMEMDKTRMGDGSAMETTLSTQQLPQGITHSTSSIGEDSGVAHINAVEQRSLFVTDPNMTATDVEKATERTGILESHNSQPEAASAVAPEEKGSNDSDDELYSISLNKSRNQTVLPDDDDEEEADTQIPEKHNMESTQIIGSKEQNILSGEERIDEELEMMKELQNQQLQTQRIVETPLEDDFEEDEDAMEAMKEYGF
ncbi:hypothetical protein NCAS_0A08300 [Naumovozyma castellii]|uniref:Chromosome segregation in meiosis protein n=1 Tax=Naumovozyma castellii TaxID=27288 RepID=G0V7E0_NAUCA|nr:hypothetical protein NCAS_0A08300 [Naumovozyma castellii CBS 4309]CCC67388.1 hypothetical protein NCAS_0A08300 [Naumovozyma castellii CBS 4309]